MEYLPATIHEHIVCQVPESDRSWEMKVEWAALKPDDMKSYRQIIDAFKRKQLNENFGDGRLLWSQLEAFLRIKYEGRTKTSNVYSQNSVMGEAFVSIARKLVNKKRRPLIFADTAHELKFLQRVLNDAGLRVKSWSEIASQTAPLTAVRDTYDAIVANKFSEAQGINMQRHADCVICRPTSGDLLEQMKGRIDRFGQTRKDLLLVVVVAEHTTEEAKFANIRLAGNFFREYIAPVATKYKERVDLEATLAVTGSKKLMRGTVSGVWRKSLEIAGQSGAFAEADGVEETPSSDPDKHTQRNETKEEPKYKPRNTVIRNKGDRVAVREAKLIAKKGNASLAIRDWLFPPKIKSVASTNTKTKQLPKVSSLRFSDTTPPLLLDRETIEKALAHLSRNDDRLASLIARVGADALVIDCGRPKPLTQAGLFDAILRAITFVMISVDAGNAFLRRLAMKAAVCLEGKSIKDRMKVLDKFVTGQDVVLTPDEAFNLLLEGRHKEVRFTHELLRELIDDCEVINGKQTGYPHLCGVSYPCGKHDDPREFLEKARDQAKGSGPPVSAGYSVPKASFIIAAVDDMERGTMSASQLTSASDRKASEMLMNMKGIGDWSAGEVLMHTLKRADIMLYGTSPFDDWLCFLRYFSSLTTCFLWDHLLPVHFRRPDCPKLPQ
jgi:3-methyladenine DNA glycosylase/8-oxoguanine DNA glycosylase